MPSPLVINEKLMKQLDYANTNKQLAKEQASTSFIKALPIGKVLYNMFENLFFSSMRQNTYSSPSPILPSILKLMTYIEGW